MLYLGGHKFAKCCLYYIDCLYCNFNIEGLVQEDDKFTYLHSIHMIQITRAPTLHRLVLHFLGWNKVRGIGNSEGCEVSHRVLNSSTTLSTSSFVMVSTTFVMVSGWGWWLALSNLNVQYALKLSKASKKVANFLCELLDTPFTCNTLADES